MQKRKLGKSGIIRDRVRIRTKIFPIHSSNGLRKNCAFALPLNSNVAPFNQ
jgi:hypothetical protein